MIITESTEEYLVKVRLFIFEHFIEESQTKQLTDSPFLYYYINLVFSEEEMDALMDRSDLVDGAEIKVKEEITGVFKRVDVPAGDIKEKSNLG